MHIGSLMECLCQVVHLINIFLFKLVQVPGYN